MLNTPNQNDGTPIFQAEKEAGRSIEVKSDAGNFLFLYDSGSHTIEIHRRGMVYRIPLHDLIEFGRTSQRKVFRVIPEVGERHDDEIVRQHFE